MVRSSESYHRECNKHTTSPPKKRIQLSRGTCRLYLHSMASQGITDDFKKKKKNISISSLHSVMQADIDPPTCCWYQPCGHLKRIEAYVIEKTRGIGRTCQKEYSFDRHQSNPIFIHFNGSQRYYRINNRYNHPACFISIPPLASSAFLI